MADEIITETPPVVEAPKENPAQERINQLSDKVKATAEERDSATAKADEAERRAIFAEGFADIVAAQPLAKDHKDEIKDKVQKGYSVADATYAVLGAAGKLGAPLEGRPQVAGGSANTTITQTGEKKVSEMSQAERREVLSKNIGWE